MDDHPALPGDSLAPAFWLPERLGQASAWWGHVPFAHWLVAETRPRLVVELGTHNGVSYAAFCRTVAELGLPTRCVAVDTWTGDAQAGHYEEAVYQELRAYHDAAFAGFSTMLRETFDSARRRFPDGCIDLLHIDGLHSYEAVRHDFETWRPAMSAAGVVLFHDTAVREPDFGVWQLWEELAARHPSFSFVHGYGLGVLAVGPAPPAAVARLCAATGTPAEAVLRQRFRVLGERWMTAQGLALAQGQADRLAGELTQAQRQVAVLRERMGLPPMPAAR